MSTKINDGGPAFPFVPGSQPHLPDGTWDQTWEPGDPGMTLRDWFAGQVLSSLTSDTRIDYLAQAHVMADEWPTALAKDAYKIADAMLAEREKGGAG